MAAMGPFVRAVASAVVLCAATSTARAQEGGVGAEGAGGPRITTEAPSVDLRAVIRGEGRPMTADRAAAIAVAAAPSVERARESVAAAREGALRAFHGFVPQLALSASYTRLTNIRNGQVLSSELMPIVDEVEDPRARGLWTALIQTPFPILLDHYSVAATVAVPVSDVFLEILPRWNATAGVAEAQQHQVQAAAADVALGARDAFYSYARARGALAVAQAALGQAETHEQQIDAFVRIGTASRADLLRAQAHVAAAEVAVARAEGGVEMAETALRTLLREETARPLAIDEDILGELPPTAATRRELVERALVQRPEIKALRRLIAARGAAVDAAEGGRFPNLVVSGTAQYANPSSRVFPQTDAWRFSANVTVLLEWRLHDVIDGASHADEARALERAARDDLNALADAVRREVAEAQIAHRSAHRALEAARVGVEAAREAHRVRAAELRAGAALPSDVLDASVEEVRAELELVHAAIDARIARARLRRAVGEDDPALAAAR